MPTSPDTFVVAASHHVLLVRPTGLPEIVHAGEGMYSGLAWYGDRLYVGARRTIAAHDTTESRAGQRGCVLVFDDALRLVGSIEPPFPMRDLHGIACAEGRLWITCSFDDLIAVHDLARGTWDRWYPSTDPSHRDKDVNHINTVTVVDDRVAVVAHRWGASEIWFFDIDSLELVEVRSLGYQAHDVFWHDGSLATCSSGEGLLRSERGWVVRTGGFPRGVGWGSSTRAVGISPVLPHDCRARATPSLRVYTPDWRFDRDVSLPGAGMVHSVIHVPDGITIGTFPPLRAGTDASAAPTVAPADEWSVATGIAPQLNGHGWHGHEGNLRWTAARRATLPIVVNPGESHLTLEALSWRPGPCAARFELNGRPIGTMEWQSPGRQEGTYALLTHDQGAAELAVIVDSLWSEPLGADDPRVPRRLGVALVSLHLR